jgi:superfamily II DNA or RNA helicase
LSENFTIITFPETLKVSSSSAMIPLEFFGRVIPVSKKIQFKLGYFSSSSITTLACGFAQFIYNGGTVDFLINHFVSEEDYKLINNTVTPIPEFYEIFEESIIHDLNELNDVLTKKRADHFYNCLRYLIDHNRISFTPVTTSSGEISHYKEALFWDADDNVINIVGSCNFTKNGIKFNGESFLINRSWGTHPEKANIKNEVEEYEIIFRKESDKFRYLDPTTLTKVIKSRSTLRSTEQLLEEERELLELELAEQNFDTEILENVDKLLKDKFVKEVEKVGNEPKFPFTKPYPYQIEAYNSWVKNNDIGLFAMATGTGKTLTSIYCLIEKFKILKTQKNIIIVPGKELVRQWADELEQSNFKNIYLWYSENKRLKKDIVELGYLIHSDALNIVITYDSFKESNEFARLFKNDFTNYILIFDEAHNMGAHGFMESLKGIKVGRRIGLSATPLRLWDESGENLFIEDFFNAPPPYTFSYSMEDAISNGFLCKYYYYPYFTTLTNEEWEEYLELTRKIPFGENGQINSLVALKRQLLLDKAFNKKKVLLEIINQLVEDNNSKYTLVYCPKGSEGDEGRIIYNLGESVHQNYSNLNIQFFLGETSDRELLLNDFETGHVDMLFAIKCLDEGVNVPKTMNAIFLASGRNYREFVQRRGRVLRTYNKNGFKKEHANIYDIVVLPTLEQFEANTTTSRKLIVNEFKRLLEFFKMSDSSNDTFWQIDKELEKFGLSQYYIEHLIEIDE